METSFPTKKYARQRLALLKEKAGLEEMLRDVGHRVERWLDLSEKTFEWACTVRDRFAKGDAKTKKEILLTIGSNLTLNGKMLSIKAKKPFFLLENATPGNGIQTQPIEPDDTVVGQSRNVANGYNILTLRGGVEDVRTLQHENEYLVKSIYHFYKSFTGTPFEIFPDWSARDSSIDIRRN